MKIDHHHISSDAGQVRQSGATPTNERASGKGPSSDVAASDRGDRVDLSGVAATQHLVSRTVTAALGGPDGGPQAVERAKALYASGHLGQDHEALANAIIDHLIEPS